MSVELILGGVGTFLGIANFIYWVWWSKRERIKVFNTLCCVWFMHKGAGRANVEGKWIELKKHSLMFVGECSLAMTQDDKEIEITGVFLDIGKQHYEILNQYFDIPTHRLHLVSDFNEPYKNLILHPKKSIYLGREQIYTGKDVLDELCGKENYPEQPEEDDLHYYKPPDFLKHTLDETSANYKISYYRYDGKMVSWRFPDKWYRNLGKKLWG
jgi:hypothetical protein